MMEVRSYRKNLEVIPSYKRVDTCAAEFAAETPYMYSTYDGDCECASTNQKKVLILGGGPNRIGQGIEFDYCCCHASFSLRHAGYETIMMNCNPETVSTDYDTSSRLYFEPITLEDVLNVVDKERPDGIIVQFGGQTPLKLATALHAALEKNPVKAASGALPPLCAALSPLPGPPLPAPLLRLALACARRSCCFHPPRSLRQSADAS